MNADVAELVGALHASERPCVIAVAGGGATAIASLLELPGASRTVLEAIVPYHLTALTALLGFTPDHACSDATSRQLAQRAFQQAKQIQPGIAVTGVGVTAALATDRPKKGAHRFHISLKTRLRSLSISMSFEKGARTRADEEAILHATILNALAENAGILQRLPVTVTSTEVIERTEIVENDLLAQLHRGEIETICHELDGRIRTDVARPRALLSGSFNPLHSAHCELARIAERRMGVGVAFEMPLHNADKPPLPLEEAERRLEQFVWGRGVWLTRAPTFVAKSRIFPNATWVVGADTAARIVDTRFYGSESARDAALRELIANQTRFLVAGRSDPHGRFIGIDELSIPTSWRPLFEGIPDSEFRWDVSSTELRRR